MPATTVSAHQAAADELVKLIPTTIPLSAVPSAGAPVAAQAARSAVVASFVGDASADMALALLDQASLAEASETGSVSVTDVLRPALEAAGTTLGVGVLGEVRTADATSLFDDEDAAVFELSVQGGPTAGWFAVRTRKPIARGLESNVFAGKLSRISNVDMALTVEVGHTKMPVRDVLGLEPGAVVELDRSAGAPADILVNGRLMGHGEIVVVDGGDYGVRITKIIDADN